MKPLSRRSITADTISQLPVWRESGVFSDRERAGLELAEAFTFIQRTAMSERTRMREVAERILDGSLRPG